MKFYLSYKGSWRSSEKYIWCIDDFSDYNATAYFYVSNVRTSNIAAIVPLYNTGATIICSAEGESLVKDYWGFTNVIVATTTEEKYYFSETTYISIVRYSSYRIYVRYYSGSTLLYNLDIGLYSDNYRTNFGSPIFYPDVSPYIGYFLYGRNTSYPNNDVLSWSFNVVNNSNYYNLIKTFYDGGKPYDSNNPYQDGGENGDGENGGQEGNNGEYDDESDPIPDPGLPSQLDTNSAVNCGFIGVYNPSKVDLNSLASFMWSSSFDITTLKKIFTEPMDCIIGLHVVPVQPTVASSQSNIYLGDQNSGVATDRVISQYVEVDCGSVTVLPYWGSYLDYNPYTTLDLYLPYIGTVPIDPDEFMGQTLSVTYLVDVISGELLCKVMANSAVMLQIQGSCIQQIPITGSSHTQQIIAGIQAAASAIGVVSALSGGWESTDGGVSEVPKGADFGAAGAGAASSAKSIMSMKTKYQHSGSVSGSAGHMTVRTPYLIYKHAKQDLPVGQNAFTGYPCNMTMMLSNCEGYTEVFYVNLKAASASESEIEEIVTLLKKGVIL